MSHLRQLMLGLAAVVLPALQPADAAFINNTTGVASPTSVITFGTADYLTGTPITTQYAAQGLANAGGLQYQANSGDPVFGGNTGAYLGLTNFFVGDSAPSAVASALPPGTIQFTLSFGTLQTAAAFAVFDLPGVTLEAMLGGVLVETGSAASNFGAPGTPEFVGFSGITFDSIRVTTGLGIDVDTLQLGSAVVTPPPVTTVAEPADLALVAIGMVGLFTMRRRRRI